MTRGIRIALGIVLADFSALTAYSVHEYGFAGSLAACFANVATTTLFVDASIALSLVAAWMWDDARRRGRAWLPYALLTLGFGSIGPLLYLVAGELERPLAADARPRRVAA
jgi:MFS superfamily sulfate permease-like transporter